ncbi:hypothetical protein GCM10007857_65010 [Bradyrhizobium iriomotense]|uniref:Uncharacterized protein n=2 Tax=Bradyrhizobium iriomotense TaxID=441950 RepID=A0ABQ6B5X1_9BRAD|nr:hypothetical protein GCM10007857_65010 [Bradyrhizobium iriomotense]
MQPWTIDELMHLTRDELCALSANLEWSLAAFEAGTAVRLRVLANLDNIRRTMTRRGLHF